MKINYIGVVAGIIAFISLALPWWTMTWTYGPFESITARADVSVYPYQATARTMGVPERVTLELWYGRAALALIAIAGIAGIVGSVTVGKTGKMILIVAGILALLSIIIFAAGLQGDLSETPPVPGYPEVGLVSSGSSSIIGGIVDYSSYLSFGFWLALTAAILAFISLLKHPMAPPVAPPTTES